jgi:hypothetical protein
LKTLDLITKLASLKSKGAVWFIENLLTYHGRPIQLFGYQRHFAETTNLLTDYIACRKGRQTGLSFLAACLCVFYASVNPYCGILVISKTKDQSGIIFSYIQEFFNRSILRSLVDTKRSTTTEIILKNESKIICRSAGLQNADTIRGFSVGMLGKVGLILTDETAFIPQRALETCSFASIGGHGQCHISTPHRPQGHFFNACNSKFYKQYHFPLTVSPRASASELAEKKATYSAQRYANEILGEFMAGSDNVFSPEDIDNAIDNNLPTWGHKFLGNSEKTYHYSLDVSRIGVDRWVLMIGELDKNNSLSVVAYHSWAGTANEGDLEECEFTDNPDDIIADILSYHRDKGYHASKVYVDNTCNDYFCHTLLNKHLLPVEPIVWSASKKEKLISHLETCLKSGRVKIPHSDCLISELLNYQYDWKAMQDHEERRLYLSGIDDFVSSLAMLCQSISTKKQYAFKDVLIWR